MVELLSNPLFWIGFSFFASLAFTYWLLRNPMPALVLIVLPIVLFLLFGPFGALGFAAGAGVRLLRRKP